MKERRKEGKLNVNEIRRKNRRKGQRNKGGKKERTEGWKEGGKRIKSEV